MTIRSNVNVQIEAVSAENIFVVFGGSAAGSCCCMCCIETDGNPSSFT